MKWSEVKDRKYAEISSALQRTVTYEPNNFDTWAKAIEVVGDLAEPLVKDGTLADYQVICDEETNTQEVKDMHMFVGRPLDILRVHGWTKWHRGLRFKLQD